MQGLTERQREILDFIQARIEEQGYPPTIREIGEVMGIRSTNGVNDHLKALERKGYLKREGLKSRALRPVSSETATRAAPALPDNVIPLTGNMVSVPVLGRVAAGVPILADEHVETTVHVDSFFLGASPSDRVFALRVTGESMIEEHIADGDFVVIRRQAQARDGQIVAVRDEDGEATLKRLYRDKNRVRLEPANKAMKPIYRDHVDILGVLVGVVRKY